MRPKVFYNSPRKGVWMSSWKLLKEDKARQVYYESEHGLAVALVASDKVPAFDEKLGVVVPDKGKILTKVSKYWFEETCTMVPNAFVVLGRHGGSTSFDIPDISPDTVTPMLKLQMLPIRAIVRGYITGSVWEAYSGPERVREFCGVHLPEGMKNSDRFDDAIFTPTTEASDDEHNLTFEEMVEHLEMAGVMVARNRAQLVRDYSIKLYNFARNRLISRGIILADAKFEFGINSITGELMLGGELFTPDSSQLWLLKNYTTGEDQKSIGMQIIYDWIKEHPRKQVPQAVLDKASVIYSKVANVMTGCEGARKLI